MTDVQMTVILYLEVQRREGGLEALADEGDTLFAHGNTFLNGLTVTL